MPGIGLEIYGILIILRNKTILYGSVKPMAAYKVSIGGKGYPTWAKKHGYKKMCTFQRVL